MHLAFYFIIKFVIVFKDAVKLFTNIIQIKLNTNYM